MIPSTAARGWWLAALGLLVVLGIAFADGLSGRVALDAGALVPFEDPLYAGPTGVMPSATAIIEDPSPERMHQPFDHVALETMRAGRLPLWMPYGGFGVPLLGSGQASPFNPLKLLFSGEAKGTPQAWFLVSRLAVAALGTLALAARLGLGPAAGALAGLAFAFSGGFLTHFNLADSSAMCMLPWLVWAAIGVARTPGARTLGLYALAIGLVGHMGHPESALIAAGASGVVALVELARAPGSRPRGLASLVGAALLGAGLAAVILWPFAALVRQSISYLLDPNSPVQGLIRSQFALPQTTQYLLRHLFDPAGGVDALYVNPWAGAVALALAVPGLAHPAVRRVALTLVALEAAAQLLSPPASPWVTLGALPKSYYALPLLPMAIALAAAAGLERTLQAAARERWRTAGLASAWALVGLALQWAAGGVPDPIAGPFDARPFAAAAGLLALVLAVHARRPDRAGAVTALVLALAGAEAAFAAHRVVPRLPPFAFEPPPVVQFLAHQPGPFRVAGTGETRGPHIGHVLEPCTGAFYHLATLEHFDAFYLVRYVAYLAALAGEDPRSPDARAVAGTLQHAFRPGLLDLANVRYLLVPDGAAGLRIRTRLAAEPGRYPVVARQPGIEVHAVTTALPRAWVAHAADFAPVDPRAAAYRLGRDEGRWRRHVLLEREQGAPAGWADSDAPPEVATVEAIAPDEVLVRATSARPGWLVLADQYDPGWQADVDGREAQILPADVAFRAVYLAAGPHSVRFRYRPASVARGGMISLASLALCLGLVLAPRPRRPLSAGSTLPEDGHAA